MELQSVVRAISQVKKERVTFYSTAASHRARQQSRGPASAAPPHLPSTRGGVAGPTPAGHRPNAPEAPPGGRCPAFPAPPPPTAAAAPAPSFPPFALHSFLPSPPAGPGNKRGHCGRAPPAGAAAQPGPHSGGPPDPAGPARLDADADPAGPGAISPGPGAGALRAAAWRSPPGTRREAADCSPSPAAPRPGCRPYAIGSDRNPRGESQLPAPSSGGCAPQPRPPRSHRPRAGGGAGPPSPPSPPTPPSHRRGRPAVAPLRAPPSTVTPAPAGGVSGGTASPRPGRGTSRRDCIPPARPPARLLQHPGLGGQRRGGGVLCTPTLTYGSPPGWVERS
ncbi:vegetative cell wall protein gp1-like [Pipra filicauda]|uniref:Vegetative cell wall protein gp1-like n=1 Tax=Pipra filicauda TaxID=649802 RepID=A0A6J2J6Q0_9PASS|nr:vegetative cell wall protein gp1-like [Pipra filicauda]